MKHPETVTELMFRISAEERKKILSWLQDEKNFVDEEIKINIDHLTGQYGHFVAKIVRWEPSEPLTPPSAEGEETP